MGYNVFAYCSNNPVMYVDVTGMVSCTSFDVSTPYFLHNGTYGAHSGGFGGSSFGGGVRVGVSGGLGKGVISPKVDKAVSDFVEGAVEAVGNVLNAIDEAYEANNRLRTVIQDLGGIIFSNIEGSAGICVGAGGSYDSAVAGAEAVVRMDIIGVRLEDGKLMFGRNKREALNVTVKTVEGEVMVGYQYDAFYDIDDNLISENTSYSDIGRSYGKSAVVGIGYHYEISISYIGILLDLCEYFSE